MGQFIKASWFDPASAFKLGKKFIASKVDYLQQGYTPTADNMSGVLLEMKDLPLAYWGIPTLNQMVFEKQLWQSLLDNENLQFQMKQSRSFWGEADHSDRTELHFPDVSHKVTDFYIAPDNMVRGSVSVLDTPNGNILYTLMKDGYVGWSSRGWGDLVRSSQDANMSVVSPEHYMHICWDAVANPAVPECLSRVVQSLKDTKVSDQVRSFLKNSKEAAYKSILSYIEESAPSSFTVPDKLDALKKKEEQEAPTEEVKKLPLKDGKKPFSPKETKDALGQAARKVRSSGGPEVEWEKGYYGSIEKTLKNPGNGFHLEDVKESSDKVVGLLVIDLHEQKKRNEAIAERENYSDSDLLDEEASIRFRYDKKSHDLSLSGDIYLNGNAAVLTSNVEVFLEFRIEELLEEQGIIQQSKKTRPAARRIRSDAETVAKADTASDDKNEDNAEAMEATQNTTENEETEEVENQENENVREDFSEAVVSEISLTSKVTDSTMELDGISLRLEVGYLIQLEVAQGDSILPQGSLALDLYNETNGVVSDAVEYILNLVSGGAEESTDEDVTVEDEGGAEGEETPEATAGAEAPEETEASK